MSENTSVSEPGLSKGETFPVAGLSSAEVAERIADGRVNHDGKREGKSYLSIVAKNLFTFFNLVWAIVTVILVSFGLFSQLTYLTVIIPNILIGIIQSIRAKKTVEKLSVTTDPTAKVIRDGKLVEISEKEIVLDDVMLVEMGKQVLSDAVVLSGVAEANESMLTGESNAIRKTEGDALLSGSFLVSGAVYARVTAVGKDNYVRKIERAAKNFKAPVSNLFRDLNNLIKYVGIFMVPMTALLFFNNYRVYEGNLTLAVEKTCGSVIGMIPAGVYLLVTLTLSLSVISLGKRRTLVQDMYSIEMLASADTVCLDKTGTITDGTMLVTGVLPLGERNEEEITAVMAMIEGSEQSINNTSAALIARFGKNAECRVLEKIPFSSARKFSAVTIEGVGSYAVGAPHFVPCPVGEALEEKIAECAARGERVLLLAKLPCLTEGTMGDAVAMISISDRIRPNAAETIRKFQESGVTVRIISGDHAATVSTIATRVGVNNADRYLSCEGLSEEELSRVAEHYTVFGRVTPEQKILLVKTFRGAGHTVAMTGDGVNDTLALKESDCAIAMGDGSQMAQKVSQIVLLDSDFSGLPAVVREGRRCINNVRMAAVLFLMKTIYTITLSLFSVIFGTAYPFGPNQFLPIELVVIGMSSLLLALEPNEKRIEGSFIRTVLKKSAPNAMLMFLPTAAVLLLCKGGVLSLESASAVAAFSVTFAGLVNLYFLCVPYTKWRLGVVIASTLALGIVYPLGIFALNDVMKLLPAFTEGKTLLFVLLSSLTFSLLVQFGMILLKKNKKANNN